VRYYVLCFSDYDGVAPHVIAEVVRDALDEDRTTTLASALAGVQALVVTRAELLADAVGRRALEEWENSDDTEHDHDTDSIMAAEEAPPPARRLHVVNDDPEGLRSRPAAEEAYRQDLVRSRELWTVSRDPVERGGGESAGAG
jgi:hypothetical protein